MKPLVHNMVCNRLKGGKGRGKPAPSLKPIDAGWWSQPSPVQVSWVRTFLLKLRNVTEKVRWGSYISHCWV